MPPDSGPLDYGQRGKSRSLRGVWLGVLPAVAVIAAILAVNALYHRQKELAQGWAGKAPSCPALSAQAYAAKGYAAGERATLYDDVTFTRQFGHVMCSDADDRGALGFRSHPVCQFTGPTAIRIKAGATEAFFEPGIGQLATVSVERGRATCALGGKFKPAAGIR
jgi:hypothetical protein